MCFSDDNINLTSFLPSSAYPNINISLLFILTYIVRDQNVDLSVNGSLFNDCCQCKTKDPLTYANVVTQSREV